MKTFIVKQESIRKFFEENIDEASFDCGTRAGLFKNELFITSKEKFEGYNLIHIKYEPSLEEIEYDKKVVYNYKYTIEKYDDVKYKLILKDFEIKLETK